MTYDASKLNNIGGSTGDAKIWIYTNTSVDPSDMDAANYFAGAGDQGMAVGDIIFLCGASGEAIMGVVTALTSSASTIAALTAVGS